MLKITASKVKSATTKYKYLHYTVKLLKKFVDSTRDISFYVACCKLLSMCKQR